MTTRKRLSTLSAAVLLCTFGVTTVQAVPGGGSTDPAPAQTSKPSAKKLKCKPNETVKRVKRNGQFKNVCVKLSAGVLPDAALYQQARLLADEGEYEWALDHLRLIQLQRDPEVLNYTGYAHRKAGRLETGIAYYQQALSLQPSYVEAREYLGEAYVLAGFPEKAAEQLQAIAKYAGTSSTAYAELYKFLRQHQGE